MRLAQSPVGKDLSNLIRSFRFPKQHSRFGTTLGNQSDLASGYGKMR